MKLFRFVHQSHKAKYKTGLDWEGESPFEAIEKYNEHYRRLFMKHYLCSRMLYFVFKNYLSEYCKLVKPKYKKEVITLVCMLLNCYKRMKTNAHVERIEYLLN